jgi:NADH:ubiquinone oxidoreductase subunit E
MWHEWQFGTTGTYTIQIGKNVTCWLSTGEALNNTAKNSQPSKPTYCIILHMLYE